MPLFPQAPRCPIDAVTRAWVERRWDWLTARFGEDTLRNFDPALPIPRDFPDLFHGAKDDVQRLMERVADFMEIDPTQVDLVYFDGTDPFAEHPGLAPQESQGACGVYWSVEGRHRIALDVRGLSDPEGLIGTIAHELAHARLAASGALDPDPAGDDHEPLTDLLTVYLGMGVLTANAVLREEHVHEGRWSRWRMSRRGYLDMPTYGFALALYALARDEARPEWARHLRPDVQSAFRESMRLIVAEESA